MLLRQEELIGSKVIAVPKLVRYVFKAINLGKKDFGVPQLLKKRYTEAILDDLAARRCAATLDLPVGVGGK